MNWTAFEETVADLVEISEHMGIDPEELRRSNVAAKNAIMHLRSVAEQYVAKIKIRNARPDFTPGAGEEDLT
jgi:CO/xanthine dehydrogenase Mo-binding subunit